MTTRYFNWLGTQFKEDLIDYNFDLLDYPMSAGFIGGKAEKYFRNIALFMYDSKYIDVKGAYAQMVKSGEVQATYDLSELNGFTYD